MTRYNVHLYREMRLTFEGIDADTPEGAASIARDKQTSEAEDIEDSNGDDVSALIDVAGDAQYEHSVTIDFEPERVRKAAMRLLASLQAILPYAENETNSLEKLKDSAEAEAKAMRAWNAIEAAQVAIAQARTAGVPPAPADIDVHGLLAKSRQLAAFRSIGDVQAIRPDLNADQCCEVLEHLERKHDATLTNADSTTAKDHLPSTLSPRLAITVALSRLIALRRLLDPVCRPFHPMRGLHPDHRGLG